MSRPEDWADYLSGESGGQGLDDAERSALDRIDEHLGDGALWEQPSSDGQFRLLAAAAAEAATQSDQVPPVAVAEEPSSIVEAETDSVGSTSPTRPGLSPATGPQLNRAETVEDPAPEVSVSRPVRPAIAPEQIDDDEDGVIQLLDRRRRRRQRATWFGAGAVVAAAAAAIALFATGQIDLDGLTTGDDGGSLESEVALFTYELTATELDPDTIASVDVRPTVAGVEFLLNLMKLDNTEGVDYYSAWLMSDDDTVPLGSFHWRAGGLPIVLWSGVDDPAYDRFLVTRQVQGDGGVRSDEVVLMGSVPDLTAGG